MDDTGGQGAFYGLGVYTAADLVTREGVNYFVTIPIAGVLGRVDMRRTGILGSALVAVLSVTGCGGGQIPQPSVTDLRVAPASERVDLDRREVEVRLAQDQIKNAPELDEVTDYRSDTYREQVGTYYST